MKYLVYISVFALTLSACSTESAPTDKEGTEVAVIVPNRQLSMEVDGMSCKMNCGGAIRKSLIETGGVSSVEFDFETDRQTNVATILFDENLTSVDKMIEAVSKTNKGSFKVGETTEKEYNATTSTDEEQSSSSEEAKVEVSGASIELPNLLDILSDLLIG